MPPNRFESEVESFLEGSHGDRTHIKRADHHTVTPLCGTLLANGAMATGWLKDGGHWYYLNRPSGAMATGWLRIWGTWYHFADNGQLIA